MTERKSRQLTPTDFSTNATEVGRPDLSAASHVRQGVEDRGASISNAQSVTQLGGAIKGVIDSAAEFRDGFRIGELEAKQKNTIDEFFGTRLDADEFEEGDDTPPGVTDISIPTTSRTEEFHRKTLEKLQRARKQGVMSAAEFNTRVLKNTREAVNKNPALAGELMEETRKTLELSGVQQQMDLEKDAAKANAASHKAEDAYLRSLGKEYGLFIPSNPDGSVNREKVTPILQMLSNNDLNAKFLAQAVQRGDNEERLRAMNMLKDKKMGIGATNSVILSVIRESEKIADTTDLKPDEQFKAINGIWQQATRELYENMGEFLNDPEIQKRLTYFEAQRDRYLEDMKSAESLEQAKALSEARKSIFTNNDFVDVMTRYNVSPAVQNVLEQISRILTPEGMMDMEGAGIAIQGQQIRIAQNLLFNVSSATEKADYFAVTPSGENISVNILKNAIRENTLKTEGSVDALKNSWATIDTDLDNPKKFKSIKDQVDYMDQLFDGLSQADMAEDLAKLPNLESVQIDQRAEDYMNITVNDLKKRLAEAREIDKTLKIDTFADGRIKFSSTAHPEIAHSLANTHGLRITWAARTMMALGGGYVNSLTDIYEQFPVLREELAAGGIKIIDKSGVQSEVRGKIRGATPEPQSNFGVRHDPTQGNKGSGFFGEITGADGRTMTEFSVGLNINGKEMDVPSMVPGITGAELESIKKGVITDAIAKKAKAHALKRIEEGKSPYAEEGEKKFPIPDDKGGGFEKVSAEVQKQRDAKRADILEKEGIIEPFAKLSEKQKMARALSDLGNEAVANPSVNPKTKEGKRKKAVVERDISSVEKELTTEKRVKNPNKKVIKILEKELKKLQDEWMDVVEGGK